MTFLSNAHLKPLNWSCQKLEQDPGREMVRQHFLSLASQHSTLEKGV